MIRMKLKRTRRFYSTICSIFLLIYITFLMPVTAGPVAVEKYNSDWQSSSLFLDHNNILIPTLVGGGDQSTDLDEFGTKYSNKKIKSAKQPSPGKMAIIEKKKYQDELIKFWPDSDPYVRKKFQVWRGKSVPYEIDLEQFRKSFIFLI